MEERRRLEQQLDLLCIKYQHATSLRETRIIYASINTLYCTYFKIFKEEYTPIRKIEKIKNSYLNRILEDKNHRINLFIDNFIKNKRYHEEFLRNVLDEIVMYDDILMEKKEETNTHFYSQKEQEEILKEYYHTHGYNGFGTYQELIQDHRLININNPLGTKFDQSYGSTFIDSYHHIPFIVGVKSKNSIEYLGTIVHEIGHLEDSNGLVGNKELNYYEKSIYQEVNSLYREKEFYEFLIKNNIEKELAKDLLNSQLDEIVYRSIEIILLSNLPDGYLKRNKYKKTSTEKIERLFPSRIIRGIEFASSIFMEADIFEGLQYSYGQVLSSYFLENFDKYQWFKERRYGMFEKRLLSELGITSESVVKVLDKKYKNNR